jgi:hypothetical protein
MATITTELDDAGEILMLLEAETTGAFTKSESEIESNPLQAFKMATKNSAIICRRLADSMAQGMAGSGCDFEVSFALKIDSAGGVMIGMTSDDGQFRVTVKRSGT